MYEHETPSLSGNETAMLWLLEINFQLSTQIFYVRVKSTETDADDDDDIKVVFVWIPVTRRHPTYHPISSLKFHTFYWLEINSIVCLSNIIVSDTHLMEVSTRGENFKNFVDCWVTNIVEIRKKKLSMTPRF